MEIANSDPNMVICGIRVLLGSQDIARTPSFVEVRNRYISVLQPIKTCIKLLFTCTNVKLKTPKLRGEILRIFP